MSNTTAPNNPTTLSVISYSSNGNDWSRFSLTHAYRVGVTILSRLLIRL